MPHLDRRDPVGQVDEPRQVFGGRHAAEPPDAERQCPMPDVAGAGGVPGGDPLRFDHTDLPVARPLDGSGTMGTDHNRNPTVVQFPCAVRIICRTGAHVHQRQQFGVHVLETSGVQHDRGRCLGHPQRQRRMVPVDQHGVGLQDLHRRRNRCAGGIVRHHSALAVGIPHRDGADRRRILLGRQQIHHGHAVIIQVPQGQHGQRMRAESGDQRRDAAERGDRDSGVGRGTTRGQRHRLRLHLHAGRGYLGHPLHDVDRAQPGQQDPGHSADFR